MDCPRWQSPSNQEDFLVRFPEPQYEKGNFKVIRRYRIRRQKMTVAKQPMWIMKVNWTISEKTIMVAHEKLMRTLPEGTRYES